MFYFIFTDKSFELSLEWPKYDSSLSFATLSHQTMSFSITLIWETLPPEDEQ